MKTFLVLLIGVAIGVGAYIYLKEPGKRPALDKAGDKISAGAEAVKDKWNDSVGELDTDHIKDELAKTGKVIRKKAKQAGNAISDAAGDARITTEIKGKLAVEPGLSALKISVDTTDGVVTLAGTVESHEAIQKAMNLALAVDGVSQVISTLQVK
ncbi:MAG: BON domain-containing protein [Verrucomicrobiota bacterium]